MDKAKIIECLKEVEDPELKRDIVTLGMVKEIRTTDHLVQIALVSSASEKVRNEIERRIKERFKKEKLDPVQVDFSRPPTQGFQSKLPLPGIQHIVAVASGKGGVGKSTVSVNLACSLSKLGYKVGLMDGDIYGPNILLMLGISSDTRPLVTEDEKIVPIEACGMKMISMGVLVPPDQPMVWRGPMLHGAVTQFLQKVQWGELDYLIVDLPPGTGDVQLSLAQTVPLTGAVMVTTPQEVSLMDVRKGILMFQKTHVPILGIIENMTGEIFGSGGGQKAAEQFQIPFLGEISLNRKIREGGDAGKPITQALPEHEISKSFMQITESLVEMLSASPK